MFNQHYSMYLDQILELVDTMVIKSDIAAIKINDGVQYLGYNVGHNKKTWKYYLNLNGQYHVSDKPMYVVSTDTLEEIEFTKEHLDIHRATARAYAYGSSFYNNLVDRYPDQEDLILGILNPIDLDEAIASYDGKILYYDKSLVESQETSLISRLQEYINSVNTRWNVKGYAKTDEYYPAVMYAILTLNIITEILNIRTELCKTNEAHSFHIRSYLASNVRMDTYLQWFTLKQTLFFYRNIKHLLNNAGKTKVFDILVQKVLTDRRIPVASYNLEHNADNIVEDLLPSVEFDRYSINPIPDDGTDRIREVNLTVNKQDPLAKGNRDNAFIEIENILNEFPISKTNVVRSKLIESSMLDTSENVPITTGDVLASHWIYLAATNRYVSQINIMNPTTGVRFGVSVKDAIPLYLYALSKQLGFTLDKVPYLVAHRVRKPTLPTFKEAMSVTGNNRDIENVVVEMTDNHTPMGVYISVDAFVSFCNSVYETQTKHRFFSSTGKRAIDRAALEQVNHLHYMDIRCDFDTDRPYVDWLADRNIDLSEFTEVDFELLANDILKEATGAELGAVNVTLGDIQKAMLSVMEHLSSYSIQFLPTISVLSNRLIDFPAARLSKWEPRRFMTRIYELSNMFSGLVDFKTRQVANERGAVVGPISVDIPLPNDAVYLDIGYNLGSDSTHSETLKLHLGGISYKDPESIECGE